MNDPRFPELTSRQIQILKLYGNVEKFSEDTRVFNLGDLQYDFFVILEGVISIEDPYNDDKIIVEHQKNEFTGDSGMLSNRGAQFHAIAKAGSSLLRIKPDQLKNSISKHSDISDKLLNAFLLRQSTVLSEFTGGMQLIGSGNSKDAYVLRDFMEKNHIWHNFLDIDISEEAKELLQNFNISEDELPIFITSDGRVCQKTSIDQVARYTGVLMDFEDKVFDLLVIGAGPAGLAASVYASSEGLDVVTIDSNAPGGQAGKSSKIENYLGFPTGISGNELANRAYIQAQKFGCKISIPHEAEYVQYVEDHFLLCATNGKTIKAKSLIAATGADYRRLPLDEVSAYEGSGVYYSATGMNAASCKDELVGVVGGGNSAGQAALFLSNHAKEVYVILRGAQIGSKMSDYLVQRIEAIENIHVLLHTEVVALQGDHHLESLILERSDGNKISKEITNLFTFIGARPRTEWLNDLVATDEKGFIITGHEIEDENLHKCKIFDKRKPQTLETSIPGFFAVGDVRKGSVKRVASAVGEGSMAVSQVHQFLGELQSE